MLQGTVVTVLAALAALAMAHPHPEYPELPRDAPMPERPRDRVIIGGP